MAYQDSIGKEYRTRKPGTGPADTLKGIRSEVGRIQDTELRLLLEHMLSRLSDELNKIWEMLEQIGQEGTGVTMEVKTTGKAKLEDAECSETSRRTSVSTREVSTDDEIYTVTVEDTKTSEIVLKGNKSGTKIKLKFG